MQTRREFIKQTPALIGLLMGIPAFVEAKQGVKKRILLRSSWQTINIGDIAHTPGVIALLEKHLPDVEVRLWASDVRDGVEEMLKRHFPNLTIIKSSDTALLKTAFQECDFLLHGSGPYLVASNDVAKWHKETGKPFGIYGITLNEDKATPDVIEILNKSEFIYFRDSFSLDYCKKTGVNSPIMEFAPDGAFGVDLRNDVAAITFLKSNGLEDGKFLCVIPKYRRTPNWKIPSKNAPFDEKINARNEAMKEHDHKSFREAIIRVVRETPMKVLVCPEDVTQVALGKEILYDPLPEDVKQKVVLRQKFWLTDEALSVYIRSAGLFGNEQHSPIMCIANGIPAIVCRYTEQTSKGIMWRDIGLGGWLFDLDVEKEIEGIVPAVLAIAKNPTAAKNKALKAKKLVEKRQVETMLTLGKILKH
jgi:polysaccharide pyruvyl transferase WcaK-like protein